MVERMPVFALRFVAVVRPDEMPFPRAGTSFTAPLCFPHAELGGDLFGDVAALPADGVSHLADVCALLECQAATFPDSHVPSIATRAWSTGVYRDVRPQGRQRSRRCSCQFRGSSL